MLSLALDASMSAFPPTAVSAKSEKKAAATAATASDAAGAAGGAPADAASVVDLPMEPHRVRARFDDVNLPVQAAGRSVIVTLALSGP
jgi:hypothetical protein